MPVAKVLLSESAAYALGPEPLSMRSCGAHNRASALAVVCPLTSKRKLYPFALPVKVDEVEGAILVDQLNSLDWAGRQARFHSKTEATLLPNVRQYIAVLFGIR